MTSEGLREVDLSIKVPIIGLKVNPIAGIGGSVDLKGTDGAEVLNEALRRGGHSVAPERSIRALNAMKRNLPRVKVVTCPGEMGEKEAIAAAFGYEVIHIPLKERTTAVDTRKGARKLEGKVSLLLFAGGDGTACDISEPLIRMLSSLAFLAAQRTIPEFSRLRLRSLVEQPRCSCRVRMQH